MPSLPRVSMSGTLILGAFLAILHSLFRSSIYYASLFGEGEGMLSSNAASGCQSLVLCILHASTCAASFLNVLSHAAVALGALNDTYVLSILVGVGFDVATRILQLVWWIWITPNAVWRTSPSGDDPSHDDLTLTFLLVLAFFYVYHMIVHVRALFMNHSLERLQTVLTGALNNLRGIPGDGYLDHVFAYTDLGTHLLAFVLSAVLLKKDGALWMAVGALVVLAGISGLVLSWVPFQEIAMECASSNSSSNIMASFIQVLSPTDPETSNNRKLVACSCRACTRRKKRQSYNSNLQQQQQQQQRQQHPVSFTFNPVDGICQLWLSSFEQLSGILSSVTKS